MFELLFPRYHNLLVWLLHQSWFQSLQRRNWRNPASWRNWQGADRRNPVHMDLCELLSKCMGTYVKHFHLLSTCLCCNMCPMLSTSHRNSWHRKKWDLIVSVKSYGPVWFYSDWFYCLERPLPWKSTCLDRPHIFRQKDLPYISL